MAVQQKVAVSGTPRIISNLGGRGIDQLPSLGRSLATSRCLCAAAEQISEEGADSRHANQCRSWILPHSLGDVSARTAHILPQIVACTAYALPCVVACVSDRLGCVVRDAAAPLPTTGSFVGQV